MFSAYALGARISLAGKQRLVTICEQDPGGKGVARERAERTKSPATKCREAAKVVDLQVPGEFLGQPPKHQVLWPQAKFCSVAKNCIASNRKFNDFSSIFHFYTDIIIQIFLFEVL